MRVSIIALSITLTCLHVTAQQKLFPAVEYLLFTYNFRTDSGQGTTFLVKYENQEYFITAKHIFPSNLKTGDLANITISQAQGEKKYKIKIYFDDSTRQDIAIFKAPGKIRRTTDTLSPATFRTGSIAIGQQCYFLGFPAVAWQLSNIGPMPLVKMCYLSGSVGYYGHQYLVFDGHNNPGFSGGPIITNPTGRPEDSRFVAVVKGYFNDYKKEENSGIIIAVSATDVKGLLNRIKNKE